MSDTASHYRELADGFATTLAAVEDDQWSAATPCEDWTVRELVKHVVDSHDLFLGFVGRELGDIPSADDDPVAAFAAAEKIVGGDLEDPGRAGASFDGFFGPTTFAEAVGRFLLGDLLIHRWDLGRAIGVDVRIPPEEIRWMYELIDGYGEYARDGGVYGQPLDPPTDADEQTRLLAFVGRKAW